MFGKLHQLSGIAKSHTTPYHPEGDGQTERMNRTLRNMLTTLQDEEKQQWNKQLSKLAFAYNMTINKTTNFSPYFLMFGRNPRLPLDSVFDIDVINDSEVMQRSHKKYVEDWKFSMSQAFDIAKKNIEKQGDRNKQYYDNRVHAVDITVGDKVLLRNHKEKGGTGKLKNYWEDTVYSVLDMDSDIPVFTITPENGGKHKRVHRNNLLKCNLLLREESGKEKEKTKKLNLRSKRNSKVGKSDDVTDSDDESIILLRQGRVNLPDDNIVNGNNAGDHNEVEVEVEVDDMEEEEEIVQEGEVEVEVEVDDLEEEKEIASESDEETFLGFSDDTTSEQNDISSEDEEPRRRTTRERRAPTIFTYDEMGNPVSRKSK